MLVVQNSLTLFPENLAQLSVAIQKAGQGPWNKVKVDTVYNMDSNSHFPMHVSSLLPTFSSKVSYTCEHIKWVGVNQATVGH